MVSVVNDCNCSLYSWEMSNIIDYSNRYVHPGLIDSHGSPYGYQRGCRCKACTNFINGHVFMPT
jgi:hypothetical protein